MKKLRETRGIVKSSPDRYMPLNEECKILCDSRGRLISAHRLRDGGGTVTSAWMGKQTVWVEIK